MTTTNYRKLQPLEWIKFDQPSQTFELWIDGQKDSTWKGTTIREREADIAQIDQRMVTLDLDFISMMMPTQSTTRIYTQRFGYKPSATPKAPATARNSPARDGVTLPSAASASAAKSKVSLFTESPWVHLASEADDLPGIHRSRMTDTDLAALADRLADWKNSTHSL